MNTEYRNCFKCNYEAVTDLQKCPQCRYTLHTTGKIRFLGLLGMLCGGFLMVFIGAVAAFVAAFVTQPERWKTHFDTGDDMQLLIVFGVFAAIFAAGLNFTLAGVWQIIFARRNRFFIWTAMFFVSVTFSVGAIFVALFDQ